MRKQISAIKYNFQHMSKSLLFTTIVLCIFGLLSIVSASTRESVVQYNLTLYHYFNQQLMMLGLAALASLFIINIPTKYYKHLALLMFSGAFVLNFITFLFGDDKGRGNINWLPIGSFKFQPSEVAKPILIICLAVLFEALYKALRNKENSKRGNGIMIIMIVMYAIPFIVYKFQGDLGTAVIIAGITTTMFLFSPVLRKDKLVLLGIMTVIAATFILTSSIGSSGTLSEKQNERMENFWEPCNYYETGGYQVCNAFIAINNGGLTGLGIGKSQQKYSYIPDPHTDMIFSIIAEENGLLGCTIIFILFIFVIMKILELSRYANTISNKYICLGVATYMMIHIFINLGGLFAIIPLTGVPLPFLSYGGTFTISFLSSLAVVQRIYIETSMEYEKA